MNFNQHQHMRIKYVMHRMIDGPRFKLSFWRGDECRRPSFHIDWKWRGHNYWLCVFWPPI